MVARLRGDGGRPVIGFAVATVLSTVWNGSGIGKSTLCAGLAEWLSGAGCG
jgi:hypothetical protein